MGVSPYRPPCSLLLFFAFFRHARLASPGSSEDLLSLPPTSPQKHWDYSCALPHQALHGFSGIRTQVSTTVQQMLCPLSYLPSSASSFQVQDSCYQEQHLRKHEDVVGTKKTPTFPALHLCFPRVYRTVTVARFERDIATPRGYGGLGL